MRRFGRTRSQGEAAVAETAPLEAALGRTEPAPVSRVIAGFEVRREIGRGGMGVVYEAVHPGIGQRAAIKVLSPGLSADERYVRRFHLEARAASAVHHPGLVTPFHYGRLPDGTVYLMMEYLEGASLRERLAAQQRAGRRMPPAEALRHARQIASAMAAVHRHNIVHRDLKPANVMLIPDVDLPSGERTKIVDFGLARLGLDETLAQHSGPAADLTEGASADTTDAAFVGSVAYASPEQCALSAVITDRSDVYSLGVMLYEMLCGRRPFGGSALAVMAQHRSTPPPPLRAMGVPRGARALVRQMLAKEPAALRIWLALGGLALVLALGALAYLLSG
jgi:serine/threonine-protein kinase